MRLALVLLSLMIASAAYFAASALSSPGGLDRRGGHHCWTNCARYGLYTGQYHCHRAPCSRADVRSHRRHGH
ncbi:MAG: hypothetical protein WD067_01095 [Gaiellaceae bacterium]